MLLALVLAAAPPPVELAVRVAGLWAPDGVTAVGALEDVPVSARAWPSPTVFEAHHESDALTLDARIDLAHEGTSVEAVAHRDVALTDSGWALVLKKGARLPLLGRRGQGLVVGFLPTHDVLPKLATVPDAPQALPPTDAPIERCRAEALFAGPSLKAPSWRPSSFEWTLHRGPSARGWAPAFVESAALRVHGFVRDADVQCDTGCGGGLGLSGIGTGSADGLVRAREAVLPAGTTLVVSGQPEVQVARLKRPATALRLEDGTFRLNAVRSGAGWVRLRNVTLPKDTQVPLGPLTTHGVGGSVRHEPHWPRWRP